MNKSPAFIFLTEPTIMLKPPVGATISPKEEINLKLIRPEPFNSGDKKTNLTRGNRDSKLPMQNRENMKTCRHPSKTSMQSHSSGRSSQPKIEALKDGQQKKRAPHTGRRVMHR
ncbi:hypothetical protein GUJ93_ZPchr0006g45602 [Zizania palustris]|uniref:Uncharacterized protein n=1 Tax=Zizania palustris TaxID=103762 RepID=A0A8J5T3R8_ZIZPA|nr:hypothetical protein GUJ93_ZPchr0006g45602 [Zizania palustris]